jgi:hypothetical protein
MEIYNYTDYNYGVQGILAMLIEYHFPGILDGSTALSYAKYDDKSSHGASHPLVSMMHKHRLTIPSMSLMPTCDPNVSRDNHSYAAFCV